MKVHNRKLCWPLCGNAVAVHALRGNSFHYDWHRTFFKGLFGDRRSFRSRTTPPVGMRNGHVMVRGDHFGTYALMIFFRSSSCRSSGSTFCGRSMVIAL